MVLWLAIAPGAGSPSADGPTDRDLMLPLHSEFRREQREQRHLFDVNLFDEPDERYEDYPTDTVTMLQLGAEKIYNFNVLHWFPNFLRPPIAANPKAQRMLSSRLDRFQASKSHAWKNIPGKCVRLWKLEVALPSNCEMASHHWLPLSRKVLNSPDISDISHHFSEENSHREDHLCDRCGASGNLFGEGCGEHLPRGDLSWWWAFGLYGSYELNAGDLILNLFDLHNYI